MAQAHGIKLKKQFGQHFLKDQTVVDTMIDAVQLDSSSHVLEIGCGEGFLTRSILEQTKAYLWVFEIDPEWACHVQNTYGATMSLENTPRLTVFTENILDIDWDKLAEKSPVWTVLANLPYNVTFPILKLFYKNRALLKEGVVMVQEEVAQKILKTSGRGYGYSSLFFQHYFEWKALTKIPPGAFFPPPKVFSRLLYFKPRANIIPIPDEDRFWQFIKHCFLSPRRTLRNNLLSCHFATEKIDEKLLQLRAQQLDMKQLLQLWDIVRL